jgi:hypothetical protein
MQMHEMDAVVPEDHRLVVELPKTIRSGPVRLIVLVPSETEVEQDGAKASPEALAHWSALRDDLASDPRPFKELSLKERRARLRRLMGAGRGLVSTSEEFARRKREEIEIEVI